MRNIHDTWDEEDMTDRTPTNNNATYLTFCTQDEYAEYIGKLQARVAEVEAERDAAEANASGYFDLWRAALSREKEAKAAGLREAATMVLNKRYLFNLPGDQRKANDKLRQVAASIRERAAALAQSGGADPAQGGRDNE